MNKREFLKTSGAFITGTMLSRLASAEQTANQASGQTGHVAVDSAAHRTNWSGNLQYHTDRLLLPKNVAEVQEAVKS